MPADLSGVGGPTHGVALAGVVQEIDIPTGRVLFEWSSLDHVPVTDTYVPFSGGTTAAPFDYFHVNAIDRTGRQPAGLGPEHQDAGRGRCPGPPDTSSGNSAGSSPVSRWLGATFWFQHHVLPQGQDTVSIFDDGAAPPTKEPQSRGILLNLDTGAMRATLQRSDVHPAGLVAANQGSMQVLADGEVLVGPGNLPYFSQFSEDGTLILDGQFRLVPPTRTFTAAWTGAPDGQARRGGAGEPGRRFGRVRQLERGDRGEHLDGAGLGRRRARWPRSALRYAAASRR